MSISNMSLSDAAQHGWNSARYLERNPHRPAQLTVSQEHAADRCVAVHGAGDRAAVVAIFESASTGADALAAVQALV